MSPLALFPSVSPLRSRFSFPLSLSVTRFPCVDRTVLSVSLLRFSDRLCSSRRVETEGVKVARAPRTQTKIGGHRHTGQELVHEIRMRSRRYVLHWRSSPTKPKMAVDRAEQCRDIGMLRRPDLAFPPHSSGYELCSPVSVLYLPRVHLSFPVRPVTRTSSTDPSCA